MPLVTMRTENASVNQDGKAAIVTKFVPVVSMVMIAMKYVPVP